MQELFQVAITLKPGAKSDICFVINTVAIDLLKSLPWIEPLD